jgi:hypothetical protein
VNIWYNWELLKRGWKVMNMLIVVQLQVLDCSVESLLSLSLSVFGWSCSFTK